MHNQRGFVSAAVLIAIVLGLIVVGGGAYFVMQKQAPTQTASENLDTVQTVPTTNNPVQTTANTPIKTTQTQNTETQKATATIDKNSLTSSSPKPTITGTFSNTNGIEVIVTTDALPPDGLMSAMVSQPIWSDRSDHGGGVMLNGTSAGTWSNTISTTLQNGTYHVGIYQDTLYYPQTDANLARDTRHLLVSGVLTIQGASNTTPAGTKDYKGAWFKITYPANFISKAEGADEASFTSPDSSVQFHVYSPQWSGNPVSYLQALPTETVVSDTSTPDITSSTNSYGTTYYKKVTRYVTFAAKDASYKRSFVSTTAGYVTTPDSEEYASKTHTVFGIKYQNQATYDNYLNDYLAFKKSLVQYAD